jgi:hypothetical protein
MVKKGWTPSTVTLGHLQKLMKHGFMLPAELEAYRVPKDHALPAPAEGYVVSVMAFYEWGFGMPPRPFLHSLLRFYDLELHYLTPSRVLHITVFVTLCEAYLGVDPDLDLWKYFFRVCRSQDPEAELTISGGAVIHARLGHGVDLYVEIPMPRLMKGCRKNGSSRRTMIPPCSLCFPVVSPFPCPPGERGRSEGPQQDTNPAREPSTVAVGRTDRDSPPVDVL